MTTNSGASSGKDSKSSPVDFWSTGLDFAKEAISGAPAWLKVTALLALAGAAVCSNFMLDLAARSQFDFAVLCMILGLAFLLAVIVLLIGNGSKMAAALPSPNWCRRVPRLPIKGTIVTELQQSLGQIRQSAFDDLNSINGNLCVEQIRANLFVADYDVAKLDVPYVLAIKHNLYVNMQNPAEINITFQPGQGATGKAFLDPSTEVVRQTCAGWDPYYGMSDLQKKIVNPELKWIVSTPVKDAQENTIAVLNVDGLVYDFPEQQLHHIVEHLKNEIDAFGLKLGEQPQVNLTMRWEDKPKSS